MKPALDAKKLEQENAKLDTQGNDSIHWYPFL